MARRKLKCNACGEEALAATQLPNFSINRQGKKVNLPWYSCAECGSCFCGSDSGEAEDVLHHQTRAHGVLSRFEKYRQLKAPMYRYICGGLTNRGLRGGALLDVGASFGGFLAEAHAAGFRPSAVDLNPHCIDHLRSNGFPAFQASTLAELNLPAAGYDAITMIDVPYYFKDQPSEFKMARQLLKPGGWLVLRTTNKRWLVWLSTLLARIHPKLAHKMFARAVVDHAFVQSADSLKTILERCEFSDISIEPDRTHMIQGVSLDAKLAYVVGTLLSKIMRRPVLVPGVIAWARRP